MPPEKRPTIGIDATAAVTQGAGIGRYTRELVRALVKENEEFRFRLFSARPPEQLPVPEPLPESPHVRFRRAPLSARWLYRIWYRLRLPLPVQIFTGRVDLFHSPDFVLPPVLGDVPTLVTVHDLSFVYYPDTFTPALVNYLNRVVPWSVKRATHVLADSQATKQDLIGLWGVPSDKVTVLYSGVDRRFKQISDRAKIGNVREKYGIGKQPYILAVSTVQPRKNYQMLVRAFKPLAAGGAPDLVIAGGRGWLYEKVMAEVKEQELGAKVRFIGFVDDGDLPALYSGASLFAFPSLYEGFGLPLLEAMACGVPVVTSDASSLPEVAGEAAIQLPPQDVGAWTAAMRRLLHDEELRRQLVAAGYRRARRFTWARAAARLQTVYRHLLQS
jgi:glycosyltransferase involved in cell wall biosynthesis